TPSSTPTAAAPEITVPPTESESTASESLAEALLEPTQTETLSAQPATTPETEPETQAQIATEAPALKQRPKVKAERLSPGLNWRNTWVYRETRGQMRVTQRGGAWARLTLLLLSVFFLLIGIVAYDQTQVLKLSFYCAKTPEPACVFQEQALLRQTRNAIPVGAIRDILVIPKTIQQPEQKEPIPVFDIVLQTTQNQIWITTLSEEPAAHILAGNIRLFAQGFAEQAAPIEQVHYVPLAAFGGGLAVLLLLLWLVWPLRWRKEFALSGQSLSLRRRGSWQSYPLSELGKLVLEPGAFDRQSLLLSWRPPNAEVQEEQTLLLAQALNATQAEALLELLKPWLQSAAEESSAPWQVEAQEGPEDESEDDGDSTQP
ncbi:MAG: hypothetical protein AB7I41_19535, partial [Candidatus Sericytochromatia bacterium]